MALVKFVHLLAVLSFAIFQVSFVTLPANALAVERDHIGRDHVHAGIIKRQGGSSKRCKPRKGSNKPSTYANNTPAPHDNTSHVTTTSTTTTAPHETPTSTPSRSSKRILLWDNRVEKNLNHFISSGSNVYVSHWKLRPYAAGDLGESYDLFTKSNYLPKFWGNSDDQDYSLQLRDGNPSYPIISTLNEPNIASQKYLSPEAAAAYWGQWIEPLAKYSKLLSPSVTANDDAWMTNFFKACAGKCSVYAMDIHAYEINPANVIKYANTFHDLFKKDVWFGEIACHSYSGAGACDQATFNHFYDTVVGFFDSTSWIGAFGWFGFFPDDLPMGVSAANKMMSCNGDVCYPNEAGKKFLSGN